MSVGRETRVGELVVLRLTGVAIQSIDARRARLRIATSGKSAPPVVNLFGGEPVQLVVDLPRLTPDCATPEDPAWLEHVKDGLSATITGAGTGSPYFCVTTDDGDPQQHPCDEERSLFQDKRPQILARCLMQGRCMPSPHDYQLEERRREWRSEPEPAAAGIVAAARHRERDERRRQEIGLRPQQEDQQSARKEGRSPRRRGE